jgi:FkbM family methyltransferase
VFEPAVADIYGISQIPSPDLILDIGANIGAFSCCAARYHPKSRIHSFEPSRKHADQLLSNVRRNGLQNITLHTAPVTADGRRVTFHEIGEGGSSGIYMEGHNAVALESLSLQFLSPEFSQARSLFIKLDCEGAEAEIIPWVCNNLAFLPAKLQIIGEYHHGAPKKLEELTQILSNSHFKVTIKRRFEEVYFSASRD